MKQRGIKQVDILKRANEVGKPHGVKFHSSDISQYVSGAREPHQDKVLVLSVALGVTVQWLMGFDYPMEESDKKITDFQTSDEKKLLECFRQLNDLGKNRTLEDIEEKAKSEKYTSRGVQRKKNSTYFVYRF